MSKTDKDSLLDEKGQALIELFSENYELNREKMHKDFADLQIRIIRNNYSTCKNERDSK